MTKKFLLIAVAMFFLGYTVNNIAVSSDVSKIAVIDVQAVVNKSAQVQTLKKEQTAKTQELQKWLKVVTADINKQTTEDGKQKLAKKYNAEYAKKQEAILKNYQERLSVIDQNISNTIAQEAKNGGYDMVLAKGVVIYGGDDITETVSKVVK